VKAAATGEPPVQRGRVGFYFALDCSECQSSFS